jgi:blocked-early-in-transport protein 1
MRCEFRLTDKHTPWQNDAFAETSGILAGTFRRMNNMATRQGCRWLWYIIFIILVFWFFVVVWWFRR